MQSGKDQGRGEQVEGELGPVAEDYGEPLDPIALHLLAGPGLIERVRVASKTAGLSPFFRT